MEDLVTAVGVGGAQVDFAVETAETAEGGVDHVGMLGRGEDNDLRSGFDVVHERKQLRDDTSLELALRLLALGRDRVNLIEEDDGGRVGLGVFERLAERTLRLPGAAPGRGV